MNYAIWPVNRSSRIENRPFVHRSIVKEREEVEALIDDTIRMIENTQKFLDRLDHSLSPARAYMEETSRRLEKSLRSLRERRKELAGKVQTDRF